MVCSPSAARSEWVEQEIVEFKRLHGSARVFALIVEGTPNGGDDECLPAALKRRIDAASPDGSTPMEPLAVDVRRLGRRDALLKIVAALLDLDFDQLKRRDERRSRRRLAVLAATVATTLTVLGAMGWSALESARTARLQSIDRLTAEVRNALADGRADAATPALAELSTLLPDDEGHALVLRTVASQFYPVARLVQGHERPSYLRFGSRLWFLPREGSPVALRDGGDIRRVLLSDDLRFGVEVIEGGALVVRGTQNGKEILRLTEPQARIRWDGPAFRPRAGGLALTGRTEALHPGGVEQRLAYVSAAGDAGHILDLVAGDEPWQAERPVLGNPACTIIGRLKSGEERTQYHLRDFDFFEFSTAGIRPARPPANVSALRLVEGGAGNLTTATSGPCPPARRDSFGTQDALAPLFRYHFPVRTSEASRWSPAARNPLLPVAVAPQPCTGRRSCKAPDGSPWNDPDAGLEFTRLPRRGQAPGDAGSPGAASPAAEPVAHRTAGAGNRLTRADFCKPAGDDGHACLSVHVALNSDVFQEHEHLFRSTGGRWAALIDAAHLAGPFVLVDLSRLAAVRPATLPREPLQAGLLDFTPSERTLFVASPSGELWVYSAGGADGALELSARRPTAAIPLASPGTSGADGGALVALFAIDETTVALVRGDGVVISLDTGTMAENWRVRLAEPGRLRRAVASANRRYLAVIGDAGSQLIELRHGFALTPLMPVRAPSEDMPTGLHVGDDGTLVAAAGTGIGSRPVQRTLGALEGPVPELLQARFCRPALTAGVQAEADDCLR